MARENLALSEVLTPDRWPTYDAMSMLGEALAGQERFAEAEQLLLDGYRGMKSQEEVLPPALLHLLPAAAERLVKLYDDWDKPDQAAVWRQALQQLRTD